MSSAVVRSLTGAVFAFTSFITNPLIAAETVEPVVVTATRTTETADSTLSPMIIIDAETIAKNAGADIADLLREYSSIEIGRNGGAGHTTSIFIRGAESNHTLVLIDGVKINPGTIGTPAIQNIDPSVIDHIEIVKGPRSTQFGSDAIGGVINIITKRSTKLGADYSAAADAGSYNTRGFRFNALNKTAQNSAGLQISGTESSGFPVRTISTIDRGYNNLNVNLFGNRQIGDTNYEISHWHTNGKSEYLDFSLNPVDQKFLNEAIALTIKNSPMANWASTLKLSHATDEIDENQTDDYAHTHRYTLDWQNDLQLNKGQLLSAGVMLSNEHTQALSFGTYFDENTPVNAIFVQDKLEMGMQKIVLGARVTDHKTFGTNTTWNIEYGLAVTDNLKLILANNTGFRAPDSTDRFGYNGNPNLKPEKSNNKEVGIRFAPNKSNHIEFNIFQNKIDDLVDYNGAINQNIDEAEIRGFESIYTYTTSAWDLRACATIQNPHDITYNEPLGRRASHIYNIYGDYKLSDFNIGLNLSYASNRRDSHYTSTILDEYTLATLTGQYKANKDLTLNARIENLTNTDYQLADGYRTPGRSGYIDLQYHFE